MDGSGNGTGANDAPVADAAPAEEGAEEEATARSEYVWLMPYQRRNSVPFFLFCPGLSNTAVPGLSVKPSLTLLISLLLPCCMMSK